MKSFQVLLTVFVILNLTAVCNAEYGPLPKPGDVYTSNHQFTVYFRMDVKTTYLPGKPVEVTHPIDSCTNECKGKKHSKHQDCDLSCDAPCPSTHKRTKSDHFLRSKVFTIDQKSDFSGKPTNSHRTNFGRILSKVGAPNAVGTQIFDSRGGVLNFLGVPTYKSNSYKPVNHWNKAPCSSTPMLQKFKSFRVRFDFDLVSIDLKDNVFTEKIIHKDTFYSLALFPSKDEPTIGQNVVDCRCTPKEKDEPKQTGFLPGADPFNNPDGTEYAFVNENGTLRPITQSDINNAVTNINCLDMNQAEITIGGMLSGDYTFPAGWELHSVDGKGQNVQLQKDLVIKSNQANQKITLNINPIPQENETIKIKTLCLEIDKPEPKPGQKYRLVPPSNPRFPKLARIVRNTRLHTPIEQVRLWIATDKASYDRIAEILVPMVGEGSYLNALYRNASIGTVNAHDPAIQAIADNSFIHADLFFPEATAWLIRTKLLHDAPTFLNDLKTNAPKLTPFFTESPFENTAPDGEDRLTLIVDTLTENPTLESVQAAINLLQARPESHRPTPGQLPTKETPQAPETAIINTLIHSSNPKTAQLVLNWLKQARPTTHTSIMTQINPDLPDEIKAQAQSLLATLTPDKQKPRNPILAQIKRFSTQSQIPCLSFQGQ